MKILYRHFLGQVVWTTLGAICVLTFVLVMGNAFKRIFDLLVNNEVPLWTIIKMVTLLLPQVLTFTIPWGLLVGILIVLGRVTHDLEFQAVHSSGIGLAPLVSPVILLSLVLTLVCFLNNAVLAPKAMTEFKLMLTDIGKNNPTAFLRAGEPITRFPGYRLFIDKKYGNTVEGVYIWEVDDAMMPKKAIRAEKGVIGADLRDLSLTLTLYDSRQEDRGKDLTLLEGVHAGLRAEQLPLRVSLKEALDTTRIRKDIRITTFGQLGSKLFQVQPAGFNLTPLLTEIQKRLSFSFAPFTLALVGIPLGIRFHRKEMSIGIVLSLGIVVVYYLMVILAMSLKDRAGAYPEIIVWSPNLIFQGLGFYLIAWANFNQA